MTETAQELVQRKAAEGSLPGQLDQTELVGIARDLGVDLGTPQGRATAMICMKLGLDPFLKHIVLIKAAGVFSPYVTRDGLLHIAHRSGQLDGMACTVPVLSDDGRYWHSSCTIHRKDMTHSFTYPGRYPSGGSPQAQRYGPEMAQKVAECMALRRAFAITGVAVLEEAGQEWAPNDSQG